MPYPSKKSILLFLLVAFFTLTLPASATGSVVRGVLFFSPTCGHCEKVINQVLPPIQQKYGDQLQLVMVDVSTEAGNQLMLDAYNQKIIPSRGVPTLIVGETVLVGDMDIPEKLPGLIDTGLASGGVALPALPGLEKFTSTSTTTSNNLQDVSLQPTAEPITQQPPAPDTPVFLQRFQNEPFGNSIAVIILAVMVISLIAVAYLFVTLPEGIRTWPAWVIPVLCVIGIGVAGYLAYVKIANVTAICSPGFGCDTVQLSSYSTLFGFLPVGVLGLIGYIGIGLAWLVNRSSVSLNYLTTLAMWGMALFGVLFSVYLTFLEPFVIGATCVWCLGSAVIITLLLWATTFRTVQVMNKE